MKLRILAAAVFMCLAVSCSDKSKDENSPTDGGPDGGDDGLSYPLKVAVLSDIHVYAESLGMSQQAAQALQSEPGLLAASEAILSSTLEEIATSDVDLVLISGDLTSNGARASHESVVELLESLEDTGIQVYVVPGNHDINNQYAVSYETFQDPTGGISADDFQEMYSHLGFEDAVATDPDSLSYVVEPLPGLRFLMLDSCLYTSGYHLNGAFAPDSVTWITDQAVDAVGAETIPVGVMHHGLVEHVDSQDTYFSGFLLDEHEAVAESLTGSGIPLVFTGHYHTMDISMVEVEGATLFDAETSSLATWPIPYRIAAFHEDGTVVLTSHRTQEVDYDPGDQDFDTYAQEMVDIAFEAYLTSIAQSYGLTPAQIASAMPAMKDAWMTHMLGDEEYTSEKQQMVSDITTQGGVMMLVGGMLTKLYQDADPPDNELTIDLLSGEYNP